MRRPSPPFPPVTIATVPCNSMMLPFFKPLCLCSTTHRCPLAASLYLRRRMHESLSYATPTYTGKHGGLEPRKVRIGDDVHKRCIRGGGCASIYASACS